ncbi:hypothetical protein ACFQZ4_06445 [Catellatospora coxensis]|uniref:Uncharacterized protein n=1 Tax=Catellatospora coxensis TaxID=310354 RepID=A0A8J3KX45_9ACTN|nr:hypothetical protein [Catellatospora coxensis]GIG10617.1 hypothetical protein Cco03nite_73170 [Catellatospora coxensis]
MVILLGPFLAGLVVSVPGTILASPAIVAFLLVREPALLATYPSWWAGAALAPLVAYLVVRFAGRGRVYPRHQVHLIRAGILTALSAGLALLALVLHQRYLGGAVPPVTAGKQPLTLETSLPMAGPVAAGATALLFYFVLRLLDRKLPHRTQAAPSGQTAGADPRPQEIWWGEIGFRDGDGSKDRPFVVLRAHPDHLDVLQITSKDKSHRGDHIPFWTGSADPYAVEDGYLELVVRRVNRFDLRRRDVAYCPDEIWHRVRAMPAADAPRSRTA